MPFCRATLSAKRFIAGVGGNVPGPLPTAAPSKGSPPAAAQQEMIGAIDAVCKVAERIIGKLKEGGGVR